MFLMNIANKTTHHLLDYNMISDLHSKGLFL